MFKIILIIAFLIASQNILFCQSPKYKVQKFFSTADSVFLVSHLLTEDILFDSSNQRHFYKLVENNKPNYQIIKEIKQLSKSKVDTLFKLLTQPNKELIIEELACFSPHHGILLFKKGNCYYYDICFHCRNYIASKEIELKNELNSRAWKKLKSFFISENHRNACSIFGCIKNLF